jgi:FemAB-related protein (PEP-CTERM system-associated)
MTERSNSGDLSVRELTEDGFARWDRFVEGCGEATFFHRAGWKRVIERSFGHRTYYFFAERGGEIRGVLPLVHMKHPVFGNSLSSSAFCVYGGPAAAEPEAAALLDQEARAIAALLDVDFLEYRHRTPQNFSGMIDKAELYVTFRKPLEAEVEKNMLAIPRKQRAMVRKGIKLGLYSELVEDPAELHRVYAESVRNLGTPVFSKRYFAELRREFGRDCDILLVKHENETVAGVMNFYFRDQVLPYYGGGTSAARDLAANDFMYWEVMRRACERGCRVFDFGRSKRGTGAFDFKKFWGFEAQPLCYQYVLRHGDKPPDLNPLNPKLWIFIELWKRLPLAVANAVGPHIVKYLG